VDFMPFYMIFLQSVPESMILIALGLNLTGFKSSWKLVLLVALLVSVFSYFIRVLPLLPGVNVFLQLPLMIILIVFICRIPLLYTMIASFLGLICINITETIFNGIIFRITGIPVQEAMADTLWRIIYPVPEFIFLTVLILLINHYEIVFFNFSQLEEIGSEEHGQK